MIAFVLAVVVAQQPQVDCATASGVTRCSQTPWGRCVTVSGEVVCGDPDPIVFEVRGEVPRVSCRVSAGTAACGYDCRVGSGEVACARTPWGRCVVAGGAVRCFDPRWPPMAGGRFDCVTSAGQVACGYDCMSSAGQVACAQTEFGKCIAAYGTVTCGDPSWQVLRSGRAIPMQCVSSAGEVACGYDCKASAGVVRCSGSPWGRCVAAAGTVTCSP